MKNALGMSPDEMSKVQYSSVLLCDYTWFLHNFAYKKLLSKFLVGTVHPTGDFFLLCQISSPQPTPSYKIVQIDPPPQK